MAGFAFILDAKKLTSGFLDWKILQFIQNEASIQSPWIKNLPDGVSSNYLFRHI